MEEIVLFDATKYKQSPGFVKVSCVLQHTLDDPDLKEEIVRCLLDTPYPDRAVKLIQDICRATRDSACRVCIEIAEDLFNTSEQITNPVKQEDKEDKNRPGISDPGLGLMQILHEQKDRKTRPPRHHGVANKSYTYERVHHYYTDPTKLRDTERVRIVR